MAKHNDPSQPRPCPETDSDLTSGPSKLPAEVPFEKDLSNLEPFPSQQSSRTPGGYRSCRQTPTSSSSVPLKQTFSGDELGQASHVTSANYLCQPGAHSQPVVNSDPALPTPAFVYWKDSLASGGTPDPSTNELKSAGFPSGDSQSHLVWPNHLHERSEFPPSSVSSLSRGHQSRKDLGAAYPPEDLGSALPQPRSTAPSHSGAGPLRPQATKNSPDSAKPVGDGPSSEPDASLIGRRGPKPERPMVFKSCADLSHDNVLLPKYGAMGPSLNYILGLDEYGDATKLKPLKPYAHNVRSRHQAGDAAMSALPKVPPLHPEVIALNRVRPNTCHDQPHVASGAEDSSRIKSAEKVMDFPCKTPFSRDTEPQPSNVATSFHRSPMSSADLHRILRSLPPTFPLGSYPMSFSTNEAGSSVADTPGGYTTTIGSPPPPAKKSKDLSKPVLGPSQLPSMQSATFTSQPGSDLSLPQPKSARHFGSEHRQNRYENVQVHGDEFLWKLFLPQPQVFPVSSAPTPSTHKLIIPEPYLPVSEPQSLTSSPTLATTDLPPAPLKHDIAPEPQAVAPKLPGVVGPSQSPEPERERLLIAVRRLPDRICARLEKKDSPSFFVILTSNDSDEHPVSTMDLTMDDVAHVEWTIERNEFGLDFIEAFPSTMQRIVIADPGIKFNRLSSNFEVQKRLKHSLRNFLKEKNIKPVFIDEYKAACNEKYSEEILAPLFHYRTPPVSTGFHFLDWEGYHELNYAFLHTTIANYQPGDWILVFNYQLMLLPKLLRDNPVTQEANVGFYLATVFPSSEMYRILPQREDLLRGILAANFIGFHGFQYKRHFFTACTRVLGIECSGNRIEPHVDVGGCAGARVVTVPRGISPEPWLKKLQQPHIQARIADLRSKFEGRKVLMGIDTLDYTKGIPNKMLAYNKFLTEHPEWINKVVFFQICVPKEDAENQDATQFYQTERAAKIDCKEILSHLYQLAGAINANFGNITYQPVQFLLSSLTAEKIVCLYALADIVVITPLRESHSWAAYEFVLCQSYTNKGVLILSEFSGSSQSLGAAAICVNPWDPHALAGAIHDALVMKTEEKLARHEFAYNYILTYDAKAWGHNLMHEFREAIMEIDAERRRIPQKMTCSSLAHIREKASTCVLILGLRGALVASNSRGVDPQLAGKPKLLKSVEVALHLLSQDPNTHIVIISSSQVSILGRIAGHFLDITLMAENGHFIRYGNRLKQAMALATDDKDASQAHPKPVSADGDFVCPVGSQLDLSWMEPVEEICRYFEERTPGCFLYRTGTSVAWNYRGAQREHGVLQARDLLIHLWAGPTTLTTPTDIVVGPHSVEVRSSATNKASAIEKWLCDLEKYLQVDLQRSVIICAANFLPRDEDVYSTIYKVLDAQSPVYTSKVSGGAMTTDDKKEPDNGDEKARSKSLLSSENRSKVGERVIACTVGLKPSRADYCLSDEREVEQLLCLLAFMTTLQVWDFYEENGSLHMVHKESQRTVKIRVESHNVVASKSQYRWLKHGAAKNKKHSLVAIDRGMSAGQKARDLLATQVPMLAAKPQVVSDQADTTVEPVKRMLDYNMIIRSPELQNTLISAVYLYEMSTSTPKQTAPHRFQARALPHLQSVNIGHKLCDPLDATKVCEGKTRIALGRRCSTPANFSLGRDYHYPSSLHIDPLSYKAPLIMEEATKIAVERRSESPADEPDDDDDEADDEEDEEYDEEEEEEEEEEGDEDEDDDLDRDDLASESGRSCSSDQDKVS